MRGFKQPRITRSVSQSESLPSWWLNQPICKNSSQIGSSHQLGVKIKTLPKTNSSPLKMVVFKSGISFSRGPPFSGAFAVSFREGNIWNLRMWPMQHRHRTPALKCTAHDLMKAPDGTPGRWLAWTCLTTLQFRYGLAKSTSRFPKHLM